MLRQRTLKAGVAYRKGYVSDLLAVSHRWEDPSAPDGAGAQLRAIRAYLDAHPEVVGVWFDFWCMPQGKQRTLAEKVRFKHMLGNVNLLYLGCQVLALIDISYLSRFWTQFEAWLSMQEGSSAEKVVRGAVRARVGGSSSPTRAGARVVEASMVARVEGWLGVESPLSAGDGGTGMVYSVTSPKTTVKK